MEIKKHFASFAEAIREGAKLRPKAIAQLFIDGRSCAIGAGAEAMGLPYHVDDADPYNVSVFQPYSDAINAAFPYLTSITTECPACKGKEIRFLGDMIWHLNDNAHNWTREAIADWLYAEEEKLGFVTVLDTQDSCDTRGNNLSQRSPASLPETSEVFV